MTNGFCLMESFIEIIKDSQAELRNNGTDYVKLYPLSPKVLQTIVHWHLYNPTILFRFLQFHCTHLCLDNVITCIVSRIHDHSQDTEYFHHYRISMLPFYNYTHLPPAHPKHTLTSANQFSYF